MPDRTVRALLMAPPPTRLAARSTSIEALAPLHPAEVSGEVLAELTDADTGTTHVYADCSTSGRLVTDLVTLGVVRHRSRPFAVSETCPLTCSANHGERR